MRAGPVSSRRLAEPTLQSYSSSLRFCAAMTERDSERMGFLSQSARVRLSALEMIFTRVLFL